MTYYACEDAETYFGKSEVQCNNGDLSVLWTTTANINTQQRAYQREKVTTEEWKQKLMLTVLLNTYARIPEVHIRVIETDGGYRYEIIDGQQRITSITDYLDGDYPLPEGLVVDGCDISGMFVKELRNSYPKIYQRIMDYRITCKWYEDLTDLQTAHLFINVLNNVNGMKPQELRNAILGFYSDYVRDTARGNDDPAAFLAPHPLFERYTLIKKGEEKSYLKHFSSKFTLGGHMEVDEWLSSLIYLVINGWRSGITQDGHYLWAEKVQSPNGDYVVKFKDKKKIEDILNLALAILKAVPVEYKVKLNPMTSLMLVLYAVESQNRGFNVVPEKYSPAFFDIYKRWSDTTTKLYMNETMDNGNQMKEFNELFGGKNGNAIKTIFKVLDIEYLENPLFPSPEKEVQMGLIKLDPRVSFTRSEILKKWQEQGGKCFYTDEPIVEDDLAGDHFIPRSFGVALGGVTEYSNLVVCSKRTNIKKSNMHGDDFMEMLKTKEAA